MDLMNIGMPFFRRYQVMSIGMQSLRSTCQMYRFKPGTVELPRPHGCAILVRDGANFYCLSCAHVLADEHLSEAFILLGNGRVMSIGGQYEYVKIPKSGRSDDQLDILVVQLNYETVQGLVGRGYEFLDIAYVETGHTLAQEDCLLISGYPASRTKIRSRDKIVVAKPLIMEATPYFKNLSKIGFQVTVHIFVKYSRRNILEAGSDRQSVGPLPYGISGSGLWLLKKVGLLTYKPFLLGIFSEYLENRALLVSTNIDLFIDLIKKRIDPNIHHSGIGVQIIED